MTSSPGWEGLSFTSVLLLKSITGIPSADDGARQIGQLSRWRRMVLGEPTVRLGAVAATGPSKHVTDRKNTEYSRDRHLGAVGPSVGQEYRRSVSRPVDGDCGR